MVKIRYAGSGVVLSSRSLIERAIMATSAKFDNNIVANRFEQTTTTTYEVTIKCVSSRGKGAKRGTTGRRTQSCCYHAWGTFFEELFRLNPEIVIVANGDRITSQSHVGWRDNEPEPQCDCEREPRAEPTTPPIHLCNASCRHNSANTGRTCPVHIPCDCDLSGWEPYIPPTVNRTCATCRYSMDNTLSRGSECPPGRCLQEEGLQHWELYTPPAPVVSHPTPDGVRRHCTTCKHSITHNPGRFCTMTDVCTERAGFPRWEQHISIPPPRCVTCAYSRDRRSTVECPYNANDTCLSTGYRNFVRWVDDPTPSSQRCCCDCKYAAGNNNGERCNCSIQCLIGDEHRLFVRFVARTTTVTRECNTCKYSYSHNNDIPCFNVVGACGSGNPKWIQWIPDIDMEGFNPELYMQQPTVMPEEKGYMDFEGVV